MGQVTYLIKSFAVGMRIFAAGSRSYLVNTAIVVGHEERAGCFSENIISILVKFKVLIDQG